MHTEASRIFKFGNHTDIGKVREENQDFMGFFENENGAIFVVCDGMGGHAGGKFAAHMAVQSIRLFFENQFYPQAREGIFQAIQYANQEIYQRSQMNIELRGMGTTCVVMLLRGNDIYYGHVGDSRLYLNDAGGIQRLTQDHSFVQALIDQGMITEEEALSHPRRNELLRALGIQEFVDVTVCEEPVIARTGDQYLLCTDGLTGLVSDAGIKEILEQALGAQAKAQRLVEVANVFGGIDNTTVQLVEITRGASAAQLSSESGAGAKSNFDPPPQTNTFSYSKPKMETVQPLEEESYQEGQGRSRGEEISFSTTDDVDYRSWIIRGFLIIFALVALSILYQQTIGQYHVLGGSGSYEKDKEKALSLEIQFYEMFWAQYPGLKKLKDKYDRTVEKINQTVESIKKIEDYSRKTYQKVDSLLNDKRVRRIVNSLENNRESLLNLADRYRSKVDWILQANGVNTEEELRRLDSLIIPLEDPFASPTE